MAVQILVTIALLLIGVANARYVSPYDAGHHAEPLYAYSSADPDYDPNPQYSFSYSVQEPFTGDFKDHQETRNGDSVQGRYTMLEADGSRRIVDYTASPGVGFNAVVSKEGGNAAYASQYNGAPAFAATKSGVSHGSRFAPIYSSVNVGE